MLREHAKHHQFSACSGKGNVSRFPSDFSDQTCINWVYFHPNNGAICDTRKYVLITANMSVIVLTLAFLDRPRFCLAYLCIHGCEYASVRESHTKMSC